MEDKIQSYASLHLAPIRFQFFSGGRTAVKGEVSMDSLGKETPGKVCSCAGDIKVLLSTGLSQFQMGGAKQGFILGLFWYF